MTHFVGTPDSFIDDARRRSDASPDDDLTRLSLAVMLFLAGNYHEAAQNASQVGEAGSLFKGENEITGEDARQAILAAWQRSPTLIETEFAKVHGPDSVMAIIAQDQFAQMMNIVEGHDVSS
jgi:hypothetical protein